MSFANFNTSLSGIIAPIRSQVANMYSYVTGTMNSMSSQVQTRALNTYNQINGIIGNMQSTMTNAMGSLFSGGFVSGSTHNTTAYNYSPSFTNPSTQTYHENNRLYSSWINAQQAVG